MDTTNSARHAPALLKLLASELGCAVGDIQDFELTLCDTQPSQLWGLHNEFLSAPRLDNQVHCFTALKALVEHANAEKLEGDQRGGEGDVAMIALFDHEEVGSDSTVGAGGPIMAEALRRVSLCFPPKKGPEEEALLLTTRKSFFISADTAHAVHPIAGQGLNMGMRDVAALTESIVDAYRLGLDIGDDRVLARYERWRRFDNVFMAATTDVLNQLFSNDFGPMRLARDLGLAAINRFPPAKRFLMRHAMGIVGDLPRLVKGEPI